jgi:hypothetical protein
MLLNTKGDVHHINKNIWKRIIQKCHILKSKKSSHKFNRSLQKYTPLALCSEIQKIWGIYK